MSSIAVWKSIDHPPIFVNSVLDSVEHMLLIWREWVLSAQHSELTSPGLGDDKQCVKSTPSQWTLKADSVRWHIGDLCAKHHEHGRHGEQECEAAVTPWQPVLIVYPWSHTSCALCRNLWVRLQIMCTKIKGWSINSQTAELENGWT